MRVMGFTGFVVTVVLASPIGVAPVTSAFALGGGGTAPGGPLSGGIRPACNGFDMDGTAARRPCDGRSVDERRAALPRTERPR